MKTNLAVIFGGKSVEHDISVITAVGVMHSLYKKKYNIFPVYIKNNEWYTGAGLLNMESYKNFSMKSHTRVSLIDGKFYSARYTKIKEVFKPDVALLCTHGGEGENGSLQGMLEMHGIAYTSADVTASAVTMDKIKMKELFFASGIKTLPFLKLIKDDQDNILKVESVLSYPIVIKPAHLGSSIGISVAKNRDELSQALTLAFNFDRLVLAERALTDFYEYNQAILNDTLSAIERPFPKSDILSFTDKYIASSGRELPAKLNEELINQISTLTKRLYSFFDLNGIVRVDYLFDKKTEKLYPLEINTIPGSLSLYLFKAAKIEEADMLDRLIEDAVRRKNEKGKYLTVFNSSVLDDFNPKGGKYLKK